MPEIQTYPLCWPDGWRRRSAGSRLDEKFGKKGRNDYGHYGLLSLTVGQATTRVLHELRRFGVPDYNVIISSNLKVRQDGLPYSKQRDPEDPGVAVYWRPPDKRLRGKVIVPGEKVIAVDLYRRTAGNLAAIAATLEAMRAIDRHGGAEILERAFTGFEALPSPNDWRHVLGFDETPDWPTVEERYKALAKQRHPDQGGSNAMMQELNRAMDDARRELAE